MADEELTMRDFAEEEGFQPVVEVIQVSEVRIRRMAKQNIAWGIAPCDLDGEALGVHAWLKAELRYDAPGNVAEVAVLDCDRKDQK